MTHIYIFGNLFRRLALALTDLTAVADGQSLICAEDWNAMCALAGGEAELLQSLNITEEVTNAIP